MDGTLCTRAAEAIVAVTHDDTFKLLPSLKPKKQTEFGAQSKPALGYKNVENTSKGLEEQPKSLTPHPKGTKSLCHLSTYKESFSLTFCWGQSLRPEGRCEPQVAGSRKNSCQHIRNCIRPGYRLLGPPMLELNIVVDI